MSGKVRVTRYIFCVRICWSICCSVEFSGLDLMGLATLDLQKIQPKPRAQLVNISMTYFKYSACYSGAKSETDMSQENALHTSRERKSRLHARNAEKRRSRAW